LAHRISEEGNVSTKYAGSFNDAVLAALANAQQGDMIMTLGAGSVSQLAPMLIEKLDAMSMGVPELSLAQNRIVP
jgi:UDP-N-acetylmuramate--alanine ligase